MEIDEVLEFLNHNKSLLMKYDHNNFKELFKRTYLWGQDIDHLEFTNKDGILQLVNIFSNELQISTYTLRKEALIELIVELIPTIEFSKTRLKDWVRKWVGLNTLGIPLPVIGSELTRSPEFNKIGLITTDEEGYYYISKRG